MGREVIERENLRELQRSEGDLRRQPVPGVRYRTAHVRSCPLVHVQAGCNVSRHRLLSERSEVGMWEYLENEILYFPISISQFQYCEIFLAAV